MAERATFGVVVSAVIITKNESKNLPRCLASLKGLVEEIVVVDSGSTDETVAIAEQAGAKVFYRQFQSYADQKNWATDKSNEPFVLSLDADEAIGDGLRMELMEWRATVQKDGGPRAWSMPRLTNYCGDWIRHSGWYPDRKIRLWSSGAGAWEAPSPTSILHESWIPNPETQVQPLQGDILHYSYHNLEDHFRQFARFAELGALDAARSNRNAHWLQPQLRTAFQWVKQFIIQGGWKDGTAGWSIARWSALSAYWKWFMVAQLPIRKQLKTIGIVRTDAIGDNVVSLPIAGALKSMLPGVKIVWICKEYVEPVVRRSTHVDETRVWGQDDPIQSTLELFRGLDAVVFAFPEPMLMSAAKRSQVPIRVATGRRWASIKWATHRVWRGRRRRAEHETLQGLRLLHPMAMPARWRFPERTDWFHLTGLTRDTDRMTPIELGNIQAQPSHSIILHPGNHGSAAGWSILRFEDLASQLLERGMRVIITGTQDERPALEKLLVNHAENPLLVDAVGKWSLDEFMDAMSQVSCVVASSTGPLHVASALGIPTVGLYRSEAPFWPERWSPLGTGTILATSKLANEGGLDLSVDEVVQAILRGRQRIA